MTPPSKQFATKCVPSFRKNDSISFPLMVGFDFDSRKTYIQSFDFNLCKTGILFVTVFCLVCNSIYFIEKYTLYFFLEDINSMSSLVSKVEYLLN